MIFIDKYQNTSIIINMIKATINFIKTHRHAIIWTLCYFACMWVILRVMFGFDMLSAHDWWRITHAHIHGFAGFVFGILILAMAPMYVATTMVIARTREPLFKIPMPKLPAFLRRATPATDDNNTPAETPVDNAAPEIQSFPKNMPNELKPAFRRARECGATIKMPQMPHSDTTTVNNAPDDATGFPLPENFDFDAATSDTTGDAPMFRDIDFDAPAPAPTGAPETVPVPETDDETPRDTAAIESYLGAAGREFTRDGDIIVVGDMAVAAHCDSDFWIADADTWFAAGKSKPSPIAALTAAASRGLHPVLYLGEQNIMDIDAMRDTWSTAGIRIITSPDEL